MLKKLLAVKLPLPGNLSSGIQFRTPLDKFGSGWLREALRGSLEGSSGDALQSARLDDPMDTGWLAAAWLVWYTVQKAHLVQFCLCQMDILVKQNGQIQIQTEKVSE